MAIEVPAGKWRKVETDQNPIRMEIHPLISACRVQNLDLPAPDEHVSGTNLIFERFEMEESTSIQPESLSR